MLCQRKAVAMPHGTEVKSAAIYIFEACEPGELSPVQLAILLNVAKCLD